MRSRLTRLGVVFAGLVALLGVTTPPAQATTVKTIVFTGTATLDGPLGIFCADGTVPPNLSKCPQIPPLTTTTFLPLPETGLPLDAIPNFSVRVHGGNTRGFAVTSSTCVDGGVNAKPGKTPAHAETCGFGGSGTVSGWCGLASGQGTVFIVILGQTYRIDFHLQGIGPLLIVTGHATNLLSGQTGKVFALVLPIPLPDTGSTPPGNSCGDKTATSFTLVGGGTIVIITH